MLIVPNWSTESIKLLKKKKIQTEFFRELGKIILNFLRKIKYQSTLKEEERNLFFSTEIIMKS